jgi:hypothetical protein
MVVSVETFICERHLGGLTLTPNGCAGLWRRAMKSKGEYSAAVRPCVGCLTGAENAGEVNRYVRLPDSLDKVCVRCLRGATKMVYGKLCISCYNRQREVLKGRNARGGVPCEAKALRQVSVIEISPNGREIVTDLASSALEVVLMAIKRSVQRARYMRMPPSLVLCIGD